LKNNILIVTSEFPPEPGGIGNHALNLAKYLHKNNFKVSVVADQRLIDNRKERLFDKNLSFIVSRVKINSIRIFMYFNRFFKIFKYTYKNEIIIASGKFSLWAVALISMFLKRKYIAIIHGTEVNFKNKIIKKSIDFSLTRFDKIIAVSNFTKSLVSDLNLKHIEVICNGFKINKNNFSAVPKLKSFPNLITVGSVSYRKGQQNVIKALPCLIKKYPNLHYHIIGTPLEKNKFLKIAEDLQISQYITFYGKLEEQEKINLLEASDIFIMLSENTTSGDVEGFGIALLEANSLGIPTIGSFGCGIEDAIANYTSGILVKNNDFEKISLAVDEIITNYDTYRIASKEWAQNFTWETIINKYIKSFNF
jgi:phosphatidyl-myo-inositol dimannoside synthase